MELSNLLVAYNANRHTAVEAGHFRDVAADATKGTIAVAFTFVSAPVVWSADLVRHCLQTARHTTHCAVHLRFGNLRSRVRSGAALCGRSRS